MHTEKPLIVCIGEILWDVLPTGKVLGGAPANVAWHAAQLGADSRIISAVGGDPLGREILDRLGEMDMDCKHVFTVEKPTSIVEARINADGVASYAIRRDVAWDCIPVTESALSLAARAAALNFGSLAQRTAWGQRTMAAYLAAARPDCLKMFDINLRPGNMNREAVASCFAWCDMLKLNAEELLVVSELFNWPGRSEKVLDQIFESYPNIRHVVVTRGADGIWWKSGDGLLKRPGRTVRVADTIGAGDSLAAAVIMGMVNGMPPEEIIESALDISSYVCTQIGATPILTPEITEKYLCTCSAH